MAKDRLKERLKRMILRGGPMSLADYMGLCLFDAEDGYYTRKAVFGRTGDFITAPEISQMFGELLGLCLLQAYLDQGAPEGAILVELGPGRGTLLRDARRAMARHWQPQVHLVEASAQLRTRQAELHPDALWHDSLESLPEAPIFLIANEFFDAFPIRQFWHKDGIWRERMVTVQGEDLAFALGPPLSLDAEGPVCETRPAAEAQVGEIAARIARSGGAALIVDYGEETLTQDTFQALAEHRFDDPLRAPGAADLTSHLAFGPLRAAITAAGAQASPLTAQGVFLKRLGIETRAQALAAALKGEARTAHLAAQRRLCHPDEMGQLFKVLGITPKAAPPLAGLE